MADAIDLGDALDEIIAALALQFPTFKTVAAEDESRKVLETPAIILQLSDLEPDPDREPHTGQFPVLARFEARVVLGHRTPQVRREVVKAAGAIATFVHNNRFGIAWGAAEVGAVEPDEFSPIVDAFDIWRIEWVHSTLLGDSYFVDDGVTPTQVLSSFDPRIGVPNENEYVAASNAEDP